ncbi:MAG: type II secretion system protein [Alphaproteobacteria bacterium]|nr:type II secretion system protein [Alphaproteobacteria bacterium]
MKNTNESGRSMVEMLGVLAIIGVLSVGGIAGYTMAMNKYRANEIVNAVVQAAVECRTRGTFSDTDISAHGLTFTKTGTAVDCVKGTGAVKFKVSSSLNVAQTVCKALSATTDAAGTTKMKCDGTGAHLTDSNFADTAMHYVPTS